MSQPLRGVYYVSIVEDGGPGACRALLAGPFETREQAAREIPRVREAAYAVDPWSHFCGFGVARHGCYPQRRPGKLNAALRLPTVIEDPWR